VRWKQEEQYGKRGAAAAAGGSSKQWLAPSGHPRVLEHAVPGDGDVHFDFLKRLRLRLGRLLPGPGSGEGYDVLAALVLEEVPQLEQLAPQVALVCRQRGLVLLGLQTPLLLGGNPRVFKCRCAVDMVHIIHHTRRREALLPPQREIAVALLNQVLAPVP